MWLLVLPFWEQSGEGTDRPPTISIGSNWRLAWSATSMGNSNGSARRTHEGACCIRVARRDRLTKGKAAMVDIPLLIRDLVLFLLVALVVNLLSGKLRQGVRPKALVQI
jgi:hypothetical protein